MHLIYTLFTMCLLGSICLWFSIFLPFALYGLRAVYYGDLENTSPFYYHHLTENMKAESLPGVNSWNIMLPHMFYFILIIFHMAEWYHSIFTYPGSFGPVFKHLSFTLNIPITLDPTDNWHITSIVGHICKWLCNWEMCIIILCHAVHTYTRTVWRQDMS